MQTQKQHKFENENENETHNQYMPNARNLFCKKNIRMSVIAPSGVGKTHWVVDLIMNEDFGFVERYGVGNIYIFSETSVCDDEQLRLIDYLESFKDKDGNMLFERERQLTSDPSQFLAKIRGLVQQQQQEIEIDKKHRKQKDYEPINRPLLFILDDLISSEISCGVGSELSRLMTACRHYNISTISILQSFIQTCSVQFRLNQSIIVLFQLAQYQEVRKIAQLVGGGTKKEQNQFYDIYKECCSQPYTPLVIMQDFPQNLKYFQSTHEQYQLK